MTPPTSTPSRPRHRIAATLSCLLGTALLGACHDAAPPDLQSWLAQARSQARPAPLPALAIPALPPRWMPVPGAADPFGLRLAAVASHAAHARQETLQQLQQPPQPLQPAASPALRALAIVRHAGAARALLQIGGRMVQVAPGDMLADLPGRVLYIDERTVRLELAGREIRLDLGIGGTVADRVLPGAPA
ncbi:pilus assembly protein PilP [Herbaspirillum sp. YR522]|uniref:pilus assembly protein PilP n=1 Tax=Herbaspirillum sp. YR522 TaxID=1144342 RepID=UPI00026F7FB6|nr:pilus assembly protein PilP [Herbaspirillum sp. YR522]EJN01220.1 Tfp pilus assembly protein PilP [Herbaspirillum sp. YR522]